MPRDGKLETAVTLFLLEQAPELARAHDAAPIPSESASTSRSR